MCRGVDSSVVVSLFQASIFLPNFLSMLMNCFPSFLSTHHFKEGTSETILQFFIDHSGRMNREVSQGSISRAVAVYTRFYPYIYPDGYID